MKKKILFVNISLVNGGAEKSLVNLLNEIPENKYEIDLLLFRKEGMFLPQVPQYVNIIEPPVVLKNLYLPIKKVNKNTITKVAGTVISKALTSNSYLMREFRWSRFYKGKIGRLPKHYDVAIAYVVGECTYLVHDLVDADKKICWVHTDYLNAKCDRRADDKYYSDMDSIVTISDKCTDILKEVFPEYRSKIAAIPNITSSEVLRKRSVEKIPESIKEDENLITSVGRLIQLKGFDMAIHAASILKRDGFKFQWFIIGNGELFNELNNQIIQLGLNDCIKLLGPKENPYAYMAKSNVVVQTSRYEGKSVVLDEAKILGIPIVSTNYDTVIDQIEPEKEGLIVEMNPESIAQGIEELLRNKALYKKIKSYLSAHEYGNQSDVKRYMDLIDK